MPSNDPDRLIQLVSNHQGNLRGGLYRYKLAGTSVEAQVWLPLARPDIAKFWDDEVDYFRNTWGPAYRAKLARKVKHYTDEGKTGQAAAVQLLIAQGDMRRAGVTLDWTGDVKGDYSPCGGPGLEGYRYTVHGVVITNWMLNNMMYAFIGREMGITALALVGAGDAALFPLATGAPDDQWTWAAYGMGFLLAQGKPLKEVMQSMGRFTQRPGEWSRKEWPSWEISDKKLTRAQAQILQELLN